MGLSLHLLPHMRALTLAAEFSGGQARTLIRVVRHLVVFRLLVRWIGPTASWIVFVALMAGTYALTARQRGRRGGPRGPRGGGPRGPGGPFGRL